MSINAKTKCNIFQTKQYSHVDTEFCSLLVGTIRLHLMRYIYVWIFENGVDFGPKHFRLPAGDSRQGGPSGAPKVRGGGAPSWRVVVESLGAGLPAGTKGKAQQLSPGGWGGSQREAFCSAKLLIFFAGQPLSVMPCRLSGWKPASQSQASWVSKLCVVRLPVADRLKNSV